MNDRFERSPNGSRRSRRSCATSRTTGSARPPDRPTTTPASQAAAEEKRLLQARRAIAKAIRALAPSTGGDEA